MRNSRNRRRPNKTNGHTSPFTKPPRRRHKSLNWGGFFFARRTQEFGQWPQQCPPSHRSPIPICRSSKASGSRPQRPVSNTRAGRMCFWPLFRRARQLRVSSPNQSVLRLRLTGASPSLQTARPAGCWSTPEMPMPSPGKRARPRSSSRRPLQPRRSDAVRMKCFWLRPV